MQSKGFRLIYEVLKNAIVIEAYLKKQLGSDVVGQKAALLG